MKTLALRLLLLTILSAGLLRSESATGALATYRRQYSNGASVTGFTTTWGTSCTAQPTTYVITTMSGAAVPCNTRVATTAAAPASMVLLVSPTPYAQATTVTGQATGNRFEIRDSSGSSTQTFRIQLGYAASGVFTPFANTVDMSVAANARVLATPNLGPISGVAPSGSSLAMRLTRQSGTGEARIYVGNNNFNDSVVIVVDEAAAAPSSTAAGTVTASATAGSCSSITVSAPYTNDGNANNTLSYRYRTPSGSGTWVGPTARTHSASPYSFAITGLSAGTYDVEATYVDADGVTGTATQTVSNISVGLNCTAAGTVLATANSCSQVTVAAPFTGDANANGSVAFSRGPAAGGPFTAVTGCTAVGGASPRSCVDTTVAGSTTYYYQAVYSDSDGVTGTATQVTPAVSTPACSVPHVTTGSPTATVNSCTQITVTAPFTGDTNTNSSTAVERGPTSTGPWTAVCAGLTGASPRTCAVSGLANATSYYFRVTFAETVPDTVQGTNPQVIGPFTTQDCRVTPGTPVASASSCSTVNVAAPFTGDFDADGTTTFSRGSSATGPWTSVCSGVTGASPRACADTGRTALTTHWYQVSFADPDGVSGTNPQVTAPVTTPACATNDTTTGTVTATNSNCGTAASPSPGAVTAVATFTGDADQDGSTVFQYGTSSGGPWTSACTTSGPSPRQCTITGLLSGVTYWVRASFTDADGVTGTNPTAGVSTGANLPTCGADTVAPTITLLVPSRNAVLSGGDTVKVQVWDAVGLAATNPVRGQVDGTSGAGYNLTFTASGAYSCGTGCTVFQLALAAQAAGTHYVAVRATDAAGNVAVVTIPFRSVAAATGSGMLLRRTAGSQLCIDCHNLQTHSSQSTSTAYGNWSNDCATCHTPHQTTNIYLVRPKVDTPRTGRKDVDFRNTTGRADYSYATVTTPGNGACEVCHTRTKDPSTSLARYRNSGEGGNGHYDTAGTTTRCTSCHPHSGGFKAGESEGEATCSGCHSTIWNGMTGGVAKATKHTLGNVKGTNDAFGDTNTTWGNPLSGVLPADRSCVNTCHDDHIHNVTDPVAPDTTASHNSLGYRDSSTQASRAATTRTTATKAKTDFDAAAANGGMCISCHQNPVDATHPAVPKTEYGASAHNTTSTAPGGAWQHTQHDDTAFARNCTKCHWDRNDGLTPTVKKTGIGGVHSSDYPSLLAGSTNPNGAPATFVCYNCHGNGTTGADYSGKDLATQIAKARNHPANGDAVHDSVAEYAAAAYGNTLGGKARHASCLDCHEPHRTKAGLHAVRTSDAGPSLEGAWGAQLSSNPAFWTNTASGSFTKKVITAGTDLEATLCFKCHSSYYGTLPISPSGGFTETDTAKEFNPNNVGDFAGTWASGETAGGFHPVLATAGSNLGAVALANLVTTNIAWSTTARNRMTCSDCHGSNSTADPMGPHGSTASFLLRGPNTGWSATTTPTSTGMPSGTFCANCHSATFQSSRFPTHYSRGDHHVACWNCHAAIPHGGPRPGMVIAPAGAVAGVGGTIAGWDTTAPYWGLGTSSNKLYIKSYPTSSAGNWARSNCGCNGTGH